MIREEMLLENLHRPRGRRWFVVQTRPRKEVQAGINLENQGFQSFLPRISRTTRHARRSRTVLAPLFPRYLFVSLDLGREQWRSVNGTFGVSRLVSHGAWPTPVPHGLVEELIVLTEEVGAIDLRNALTPGDRVRFLSGPFAEAIGRLVALDDAGRARVLLELLGSEREISVAAEVLAPASD